MRIPTAVTLLNMKFYVVLFGLPALGIAAPIPKLEYLTGLARSHHIARATTATSITQAATNWQKDTGVVSNFLNDATSLTGTQFTSAASAALAAEKDELTQKAVLDADTSIASQTVIKSANNALTTQGNFQDVVNLLQDMVTKGSSVAVADTNSINAVRCKEVLPSIDDYLEAAGTSLQAVRPSACSLTGATESVGPSKNSGAASGSESTRSGGEAAGASPSSTPKAAGTGTKGGAGAGAGTGSSTAAAPSSSSTSVGTGATTSSGSRTSSSGFGSPTKGGAGGKPRTSDSTT